MAVFKVKKMNFSRKTKEDWIKYLISEVNSKKLSISRTLFRTGSYTKDGFLDRELKKIVKKMKEGEEIPYSQVERLVREYVDREWQVIGKIAKKSGKAKYLNERNECEDLSKEAKKARELGMTEDEHKAYIQVDPFDVDPYENFEDILNDKSSGEASKGKKSAAFDIYTNHLMVDFTPDEIEMLHLEGLKQMFRFKYKGLYNEAKSEGVINELSKAKDFAKRKNIPEQDITEALHDQMEKIGKDYIAQYMNEGLREYKYKNRKKLKVEFENSSSRVKLTSDEEVKIGDVYADSNIHESTDGLHIHMEFHAFHPKTGTYINPNKIGLFRQKIAKKIEKDKKWKKLLLQGVAEGLMKGKAAEKTERIENAIRKKINQDPNFASLNQEDLEEYVTNEIDKEKKKLESVLERVMKIGANNKVKSFEEKVKEMREFGYEVTIPDDRFFKLPTTPGKEPDKEYYLNIKDLETGYDFENAMFESRTLGRTLMKKFAAQNAGNEASDKRHNAVENKNNGKREWKKFKDYYSNKMEQVILDKLLEKENSIARKVSDSDDFDIVKRDAFFSFARELLEEHGIVIDINTQKHLTFYRLENMSVLNKKTGESEIVIGAHKYKSSDMDSEKLSGDFFFQMFGLREHELTRYHLELLADIFPERYRAYKTVHIQRTTEYNIHTFKFLNDNFNENRIKHYNVWSHDVPNGMRAFRDGKSKEILFLLSEPEGDDDTQSIRLSPKSDKEKQAMAMIQDAKETITANGYGLSYHKTNAFGQKTKSNDAAFMIMKSKLSISDDIHLRMNVNVMAKSSILDNIFTIHQSELDKKAEKDLYQFNKTASNFGNQPNFKNAKKVYDFKNKFFAYHSVVFANSRFVKDFEKEFNDSGLNISRYFNKNHPDNKVFETWCYKNYEYYYDSLEELKMEVMSFDKSVKVLREQMARLEYYGIRNATIGTKPSEDPTYERMRDVKELYNKYPELREDVKRAVIDRIYLQGERYKGHEKDVENDYKKGEKESDFGFKKKIENKVDSKNEKDIYDDFLSKRRRNSPKNN